VYEYIPELGEYRRIRGEKARLPSVSAMRLANANAEKNGTPPAFVEYRIGVRNWGDAPPTDTQQLQQAPSLPYTWDMGILMDRWVVSMNPSQLEKDIVGMTLRGVRSMHVALALGIQVYVVGRTNSRFQEWVKTHQNKLLDEGGY
jgi:hypothetical protein